ncbi:MAG TPA: PilZ domain-containing protein [Vicinamibacterales bacterium]|nr:PilZ domain-containing protein [Vicinamibacterales bacterium]
MSSSSCTVIVGASQFLEALRERAGAADEVLSFSDRDAPQALEAMLASRPGAVVLERLFAATSRGAALINRIKADPCLAQTEIRIVSHDGSYSRVSPRRTPAVTPAAAAGVRETSAADTTLVPAASLDYHGTRRAPRYRMAEGTSALVDGTSAGLIDLSSIGAQIVSPAVVRPQQSLRVTLSDDAGVVRMNAAVAWVRFEIPNSTPQYRAGIEFNDAKAAAVDAFCKRHQLE